MFSILRRLVFILTRVLRKLFLKRNTLSVYVHAACKNHNALDQTPNSRYGRKYKAGKHRDKQLCKCLAGKAEVEVMYAGKAKENTQKARNEFALLLCSRGSHRLTGKLIAALYAHDSKRIALL